MTNKIPETASDYLNRAVNNDKVIRVTNSDGSHTDWVYTDLEGAAPGTWVGYQSTDSNAHIHEIDTVFGAVRSRIPDVELIEESESLYAENDQQ